MSSTATASSPEGLVVNRKWRIGSKLGDGVCGSVHELIHDNGDDKDDLAIKVAPLPDSRTSKKSQAARKRHADILHYESLVYQNHLVELRGTLIPELPLRPATGDVKGFRYLIMEQMAAPFETVVSDIASGKRHFGQVAAHLLHIVQQVHQRKLLVIDIKPDNFMVDNQGNVVMIDLGLVQSYASISGHRPNNAGASVVGTPLYASLHLFDGNTPSRRDDLEALCYLLMEVVLQIGTKEDLPWSHGQSEEEIGRLKRDTMSTTAIWKKLATSGNTAVAKALRSFFEDVNLLGYSKTPDYDTFESLLQGLTLSKKKKPAARRSTTRAAGGTSTTSTRASKTTTASRADRASARGSIRKTTTTTKSSRASRAQKRASPEKQTSRRAKRQEVVNLGTDDDDHDDSDDFQSVVDQDQEVDADDFHTCANDDDHIMEWENEDELDSKPRATNNKPKAVRDTIGVTLKIIDGPHEGESVSLIHLQDEMVVFGARPDVEYGYDLISDSQIDLQHASLQLHVQNKKLVTVIVTDLKSSSGTYVGKTLLLANRTQKIFVHDVVTMGETRIRVCPLVSTPSIQKSTPVQVSSVSDVEMYDLDLGKELEEEDDVKENKKLGVHFVGKAHEFVLTQASKTLVLGSDPATSNVVIPGVAASSCQLTLQISSRQVLTTNVKAIDGDVSINGNLVRRDGKLFVGDVLQIGNDALSWKMSATTSKSLLSAGRNIGKPAAKSQASNETVKKLQAQTSSMMAAKTCKSRRGMALLFTTGPYKGERIEMQEGTMDTLVLGANPRSRSGGSFRLTKDTSITDASHVRLELNTNNKKGFCTMTVTDLKSSCGTTINALAIGKGKKETAFCGDAIALGCASSLKLQPL